MRRDEKILLKDGFDPLYIDPEAARDLSRYVLSEYHGCVNWVWKRRRTTA